MRDGLLNHVSGVALYGEQVRRHRIAGLVERGNRSLRRFKGGGSGGGAGAAQGSTMTPQQANLIARQACIKQGVDMWQQIFSQTYNANIPSTVINVGLRNVGLVKRLLVKITATVQANGQTLTLCPFGPSQALSNVTLTDLSNQTRINTGGWHLFGVSSAKRRQIYGAAYTTDTPQGYGSNFPSIMAAPAQITTNPAVNNFFAYLEVPLAYTDMDLRGALYMNVTNANAYLSLTINPNFFVAAAGDPTFGVYQSNTATLGVLSSLTVTVWQNYLDQLPIAQNGGPVLPLLDLSTAYIFNTAPIQGLVANQAIPIPYANFRDFMSTMLVYDNDMVLNPGTDLTRIQLQSANYTNILDFDPNTAALLARLIFKGDPPKGVYYLDHRHKPISTIQYGNMQLAVTPAVVNAPAGFTMGYEMLALINMITQAGSLFGT